MLKFKPETLRRDETLKLCSRIALFVILAHANCANSQPISARETEFLYNLRDINIDVTVAGTERCPLPASQIRAEIINRTVPAGLSIQTEAAYSLGVHVASLESSGLCAASISSVLLVLKAIPSPRGTIFAFDVPIIQRSQVLTVGAQRYNAGALDVIRTDIDYILSRWREANAGADFVRQRSPDTGPNIRTVQRRLADLGLYQGQIDANYGPATRTAVQTFQRQTQLPATGDLDQETMRRLFP